MKKKLLLVAAVIVVACGSLPPLPPRPTPTPAPSPTPTPSPTPPPAGHLTLLHRTGTDFKNAKGKVVHLQGYGGVCCGKGSGPEEQPSNGWPWIADSYLRELAANGGNYAHIRLGPNGPKLEPRADMRPFLDYPAAKSNGIWRWNPAYFKKLNALLDLADSLGVYIEVDLVDGWMLKDPTLGAWGPSESNCQILQAAPKPIHQDWLEKVEKEIGAHDNVIYQIGNETFGCSGGGSTLAWELGVVDTVHTQEEKSDADAIKAGLPRHQRHMMATNAGIGKVDRHGDIDYITTHQSVAAEQTSANKPVTVNEYNPWIGLAEFKKQLGVADKNHTNFFLWVSDASESQRIAALAVIKEWRKTHP